MQLEHCLLKAWRNVKSWGPAYTLRLRIFLPSSPQLTLSLAAIQTRIDKGKLVDSGNALPVLLDEGHRLLKDSFKVKPELLRCMEGVRGIINKQKSSLDKSREFIQQRQVSLDGYLIHMGDLEPSLQGSSDLVREGKQCHTAEESHGSDVIRHSLIEDQQGLRDSPRPKLAQDWVTAVVHGSGHQHMEGALVGSPEAMGRHCQPCKSAPVGLAGSLDEQENPLLERSISEPLENMRKEYGHFEALEVCMEGTQIQIPGSPSYLKEQDSAVVLAHGKRDVNYVCNAESTEPLKEVQRRPVEDEGSIHNDNGTKAVSDKPVGKLDTALKIPSFDQEECCTRGRPFPMEVSPMSLEWQMGSNWPTEDSPLPAVALPRLNCQEAARTEAEKLYLEPSVSAVLQDTDASEELENTMDENKRKKRKRCRQRKKKKKLEPPDSADISWLAELPFVNTKTGTIFEIPTKSDKTVNQKRKQKNKKNKDDLKEKKPLANYFISLPITNPKIIQDIEMIQDALVKKEGRLSKAMVPHGSLHITLFVMHIASEDDVSRAINALSESKDVIQEILQGKSLALPFEGVADFRNEVIFAKLAKEESTSKLILVKETLEKIFNEKGILVKDDKAFTPHLTIMKLSRSPKIRKQGLKKIDIKLYEEFKSHYFGEETLTSLDLCSMVKKRQSSGYYHSESSVTFAFASCSEYVVFMDDGFSLN
ncbi:A-kinase anchoring protein 7 isoform X3 [Pleurodeles waltl]|uniref:A-kinase anchoring protein 7 isoform X3 n=1 Tax=Pleurodeles waltl TaxID=8319 RepID=UPI003709AD3E